MTVVESGQRSAEESAEASGVDGLSRQHWRVLEAIRRQGRASKADLVDELGASWQSIGRAIEALASRQVIEPLAERGGQGKAGANSTLYRVKGDAGVFVGIDIGVADIRAVGIDFAFHDVDLGDVGGPTGGSISDLVVNIRQVINDSVAAVARDGRPLLGVGFAWPGGVDQTRPAFRYAPNLPFAVEDLPLMEFLPQEQQAELGKVVLDHDCECAAIAEMWVGDDGGPRTQRDVVVLYLDRGVGAGLILGGDLYRGVGNNAGEIGHFVAASDDGSVSEEECGCGRVGCLELAVSVPSILRRANVVETRKEGALLDDDVTIEYLAKDVSDDIMQDVGHQLATAASLVLNLLNPEVMVLAGTLATQYDRFYPAFRERLGELVWRYALDNFQVEPSRLGRKVVATGAAISAYRALAVSV